LLAKLKRDGSTESYKELDLEYQDFYYHKVKTNRLYKLAYWLQKKWWNFGYEKELIFFHSVWMFLLASFFIQGFFIVKTLIWERFLFLTIAFLLVSPSGLSIGTIHINQHITNIFAVLVMVGIYFLQRSRRENESSMVTA